MSAWGVSFGDSFGESFGAGDGEPPIIVVPEQETARRRHFTMLASTNEAEALLKRIRQQVEREEDEVRVILSAIAPVLAR